MPALVLNLLGGFQVLRRGTPVTRFRGDKVRGLLAYLAVESQQAHARSSLAALFWPDQPDDLALRNLSQALVRLREALGDDDGALIEASRHSVRWADPAAVDVTAFVRLARGGSPEELEAAAASYAGELLAGFALDGCEAFEEWLLLTREQLAQLALSALDRLVAQRLEAGSFAAAAELARRQIGLDPWRESAHQQLMRALAGAGDRAAALAAFERCRALLRADLGVDPDPATEALAEQIRRGPAPGPPAARPAALPAARAAMVGREEELAAVDGLVRGGARLVTVAGPGGVGKSRLALAAATILRDELPDGAWWVGLAGVPASRDDDQLGRLAGVILAALEHRDRSTREPLAELRERVGARRLLLVLDNCEHLPAAAPLLDELLERCPGLQVLATSRERLGLPGEELLLLEGLPAPAEGAAGPEGYAAVQLFLAEARRQVRGFGGDPDALAGVARLCRVLEGMPLGIQLAAHWVAHFSCDEIADAVLADFSFLAARDRQVPDRHRSLRAVFDYSWGLLGDVERQGLARLSVFIGQFDRAAAQTVAGSALTTLAVLVDKSLLRRVSAGRYTMHELLRQFAGARLQADPAEQAAVAERHSAHYLGFVAGRAERLAGDDAPAAADEIRAELGNIRQAWLWAAAGSGAALAPAAYGLLQFFWHAGLIQEGAEWFTQARTLIEGEVGARPEARPALALLLALNGRLLLPQGRHAEALALAERASALADGADAPQGEALGALVRGMALRRLGRSAEARGLLLRAAAIARAAGLPAVALADAERLAYNWLCSIALSDDDYAAARDFAERNLAICLGRRMRHGEMFARSDLLDIAMATGDYPAARDHCAAMLRLARDLRFREGEAVTLHELGKLARLDGDYAAADRLLTEALEILRGQGNHIRAVLVMQSLAELHRLSGGYARAAAWIDQALELLRAAGQPLREWAFTLRERARLRRAAGDLAGALADAEAALPLLEPDQGRADRARARALLARLYADGGRRAESAAAYDEALAIYLELGLAHRAAEVRAGLAELALAGGDPAAGLAHAEALLPALRLPAQLDDPLAAALVCYRALRAADDGRAVGVLREARELLLRRAAGIADPAWRAGFLHDVAAHRAIMLEPDSALILAGRRAH